MDLNSLFRNLRNYEETKVVHKEIMKESNKEKFISLMSRKETIKYISELENLDSGEQSDEDHTDELVSALNLLSSVMKKE